MSNKELKITINMLYQYNIPADVNYYDYDDDEVYTIRNCLLSPYGNNAIMAENFHETKLLHIWEIVAIILNLEYIEVLSGFTIKDLIKLGDNT